MIPFSICFSNTWVFLQLLAFSSSASSVCESFKLGKASSRRSWIYWCCGQGLRKLWSLLVGANRLPDPCTAVSSCEVYADLRRVRAVDTSHTSGMTLIRLWMSGAFGYILYVVARESVFTGMTGILVVLNLISIFRVVFL